MTGRRAGKEARVTLQPGPHRCGHVRVRAQPPSPTSRLHRGLPPRSRSMQPAEPRWALGTPPLPPPAAAEGTSSRHLFLPRAMHLDLGSPQLGRPSGGHHGEWEGGTREWHLHPSKLAPGTCTGRGRPNPTTPTQGLHEGLPHGRPQSSRGPAGLTSELEGQSPLPSRRVALNVTRPQEAHAVGNSH